MPSPVGSCIDAPYTPASDPDGEALTCSNQPDPAVTASSSEDLACRAPQGDRETSPSPQKISGPHAEAHATATDLYAGAFALKGRDAASGIELEVFSVSAHGGIAQRDAQAGMVRLGTSSDNGHFNVRGEAFTAKAHEGIQNPDGSVGVNAGLGVTAVGAEATGTFGPASLTVGASVSVNLAGSIGIREADEERNVSLCARVELAVFTLGTCIEKVW